MPDDLHAQICQVISDVFDLPIDSIDMRTSPETVDSWDSISHLNLVLSLEQAFDVSLSPEEIAQLVSVEAIAEFVCQKRAS